MACVIKCFNFVHKSKAKVSLKPMQIWKIRVLPITQNNKLYISGVRYNNHRTKILIPKCKNRKSKKDYCPEEYVSPT